MNFLKNKVKKMNQSLSVLQREAKNRKIEGYLTMNKTELKENIRQKVASEPTVNDIVNEMDDGTDVMWNLTLKYARKILHAYETKTNQTLSKKEKKRLENEMTSMIMEACWET